MLIFTPFPKQFLLQEFWRCMLGVCVPWGARFGVYARLFLIAGCGLVEGHIAPDYSQVVARVVFNAKLNGSSTFYMKKLCGVLGTSGCLLGTSWCLWVPPGCLLAASWCLLIM